MCAKVLIADEGVLEGRVLRDTLALENYDILVSTSGKETLDILSRENIDVVLINMILTGIGADSNSHSIENIRRISEISPKTKVIILTAWDVPKLIIAALRLHVHDFLIKPVETSEIINSIRNSLSSQTSLRYREELENTKVFISYAREDEMSAKKLYNNLKQIGLMPWLDIESLTPGNKWRTTISQAIRDSRFFIALFSNKSVNKKGFLQKELKEALEVLDEYPESSIYFIPARLDDCIPSYPRINELHWVNMFPDWNNGLEKIVSAMIITLQT